MRDSKWQNHNFRYKLAIAQYLIIKDQRSYCHFDYKCYRLLLDTGSLDDLGTKEFITRHHVSPISIKA